MDSAVGGLRKLKLVVRSCKQLSYDKVMITESICKEKRIFDRWLAVGA